VVARDGTKVPLTLIYRQGLKRDGNNPTILYGYGAYGVVLSPFLVPPQLEWYRLGGISAIAHVRGGGEFGEEWHLAGKDANKPNTWRDAIDCADFLVKQGYTSSSRLAIFAGSAGGILAGRAITERPDLFAAAAIAVPIVDTLRFERAGVGPANRNEFGSVATEPGFRALYEMSSYEHVKPGTRYPAVLLMTGANDPRVPPWQPAKFAARLQTATSGGKPVLLRVDEFAGHNSGDIEGAIQENLDMFSFFSLAIWNP